MSEKDFTLDDILSDLKQELKVNGISDITDDEIKKYSVEMDKYDTATLLNDVNETLTGNDGLLQVESVKLKDVSSSKYDGESNVYDDNEKQGISKYKNIGFYNKENQEHYKENFYTENTKQNQQVNQDETYNDRFDRDRFIEYSKEVIKEEDNNIEKKQNDEEIKKSVETSNENISQENDLDDSTKSKKQISEKEQLINEIKSMTSEELKKQEEIEEQRLRELMLSTAHIKYISLRKNREKLVKEFVLNPQYTTTQPLEIQESLKENTEKKLEKDRKSNNEEDISVESREITKQTQIEENKEKNKWKEDTSKESFKIDDIDYEGLGFQEDYINDDIPHEYTKDSQTATIKKYLQSMQKYLKSRLIALGVIGVISILMSFLADNLKSTAIPFLDKTNNPLSFCITNLVLLIAIIGISYDTLLEGVYSIFQKVITRNTILSIAFVSMLLVNIAILFYPQALENNAVNLYVPLASVCAFGSILGRYLDAQRRALNFSILSNKDKRYSVTIMENQKMAEDFTKAALEDYPTLVYNKKTTFLSCFMDESFGTDESDISAKRVLPVVLGLAGVTLIISLLLGQDLFVALGVFNGILLVGTGVLPFLMVSLPLWDTAKKLSPSGGAILSVDAAEDYIDVNSIALDATQIFDGQDVTLYGIKTFSDITIDKIILDATSVLCESNSILGEVFLNIINNREDYLEKCDSLIYEDGMGISAWIGNRRILIGSRELMKNHNINVPSTDFEKKFIARDRSLVYLSTGGELSAVFMIGLECNMKIKKLVAGLYNNDIVSIVRTVDPILTRCTLAKVFGLPENAFRVIPSRLHKELSEISKTDKPVNATVCNDGSLKGYIYSLLFAKKLPKIIQISLAINYVIMGLAVLLFVAFTFLNGVNQLNNFIICAYQIIFAVICYLLQKFYKI